MDENSEHALAAIWQAVLAHPAHVRQFVEHGVGMAELELKGECSARRWLDEQAGALALVQTRALLDRVQAAYTDYGVRVGDLVAEC